MSKRKVCVEVIVDYIYRYYDKPERKIYTGGLKINGVRTIIEVDVKSKKNVAGEAWDWAQSHWDEFLDEQGPSLTITLKDGTDISVATTLRWACVTGVEGPKGEDLPLESVSYRTGKNRAYAQVHKGKKGEKLQRVKVRENKTKDCALISKKKTKSHGTPLGYQNDKPVKTQDKSSSAPASAEVVSFEEMKAKKIEEAMLAEE